MHNGKIIHFEDNAQLRNMVSRSLSFGCDHEVVGSAGDLPSALAMIDSVEAGEIDANIVLLDGDLSEGLGTQDAFQIAEHIRELGLPMRIIGFSTKALGEAGVSVDAELNKKEFSKTALVETIDQLEDLAT